MTASTRRDFLATTAIGIGTAAGWQPRRALWAAERADSGMKFGLVTYLWGRDWDLPTLIANCEQAGCLGVELRTTHAHVTRVHADQAGFPPSRPTSVLGSVCAMASPSSYAHAASSSDTSASAGSSSGTSPDDATPPPITTPTGDASFLRQRHQREGSEGTDDPNKQDFS